MLKCHSMPNQTSFINCIPIFLLVRSHTIYIYGFVWNRAPFYPVVTLWWTNIAMENGHRHSGLNMAIDIVSFPIKNGGSFHCCVSSPEGNHHVHCQKGHVKGGGPQLSGTLIMSRCKKIDPMICHNRHECIYIYIHPPKLIIRTLRNDEL